MIDLFGLNLLDLCFPAPYYFYSVAGSVVTAPALGLSYGLIGRVTYPNAGIIPMNYAIWFTIAYQIKYVIQKLENLFEQYLGVKAYLKTLEKTPEDQLDLQNKFRVRCWKVIRFKNRVIKKVDDFFSKMFKIRLSCEVTEANVDKASFLEMCRYRIWKVFKMAVYDTISSALAYPLTNRLGFLLPEKTAVPIFLIIRIFFTNIVLIPSIYLFLRSTTRFQWTRDYIPAL